MLRRRSPFRRRRRRRGTIVIFGRRLSLRYVVPFVLMLIVGIVSASMLIDYAVDSARRKQENSRLSQDYSDVFLRTAAQTPIPESSPEPLPVSTPTPEPQLLDSYRSLSGDIPKTAMDLYRQNSDLVGWLYIRGVVSLPVVYFDNEYYLDHDFNGKNDSGGTLFLDQYHPLTESAQHLVIHGHNMYDSSMFGILSGYGNLSKVKSNPFATFSTLYAAEEYVCFAVLRVNPDTDSSGYFNYVGKPYFSSVGDFYSFTGELKQRSMFDIPIDVSSSDALLTLSTCVDDDRLAVFYRRIRDGETKEELQAQVDLAYKR